MREIKFRVFHKEEKKMCRVICSDYKDFIVVRFPEFEHETNDYNDQMLLDEFEPPQQYTGLKDKNGVEIYEGDIVKLTEFVDIRGEKTETYICKVGYRGLGFNITNNIFSFSSWERIEVIGNIYETPELLK